MKHAKAIPFQFVLDELSKLEPVVKPMFGCYAIYIGPKVTLMLRKKDNLENDNGVWVAIPSEHQDFFKKKFRSLRPIGMFSEKKSDWLNMPETENDFEESVLEICSLVLKKDPRIGKIPKSKKGKGK